MDQDANKIDVVIEIPKGSNVKYEYDRQQRVVKVDRILFGSDVYPQNYGFIPETLDFDGDELDALVLADQSFNPGTVVPVRIIGAMEMVDNGETDTKLITVIDVDPRYQGINNLGDVAAHRLAEIEEFFAVYKRLQKKSVVVKGFQDHTFAIHELATCYDLAKQYGQLSKVEFLLTMKRLYPDKYPA